ncbi:MAG: hypothetical protein M3N52_12365 [Actinomycetota bacterium]|nr:hypothetical protein [Actinomycetota bacterium]
MVDTESAIHHAVPVFVQIFQGRVLNAARARDVFERWIEEVAPGADGWQGSTAGITEDGEMIAVVRFASPEAARRSNERPEQNEWWEEMRQQFTDDVTFHDCTNIAMFGGEEWGDAGFVEVVQGYMADLGDMMEVRFLEIEEHYKRSPELEILGGLIADHGDGGGFTELVLFRSEQQALDEEGRNLRPEISSLEALSPYIANLRHLTIRDPWIYGRRIQ